MTVGDGDVQQFGEVAKRSSADFLKILAIFELDPIGNLTFQGCMHHSSLFTLSISPTEGKCADSVSFAVSVVQIDQS